MAWSACPWEPAWYRLRMYVSGHGPTLPSAHSSVGTFREQSAASAGQVLAEEPAIPKVVVSATCQDTTSTCTGWSYPPYLSMSSTRSPFAKLNSSGLRAWKSCTTRRSVPGTALFAPFLIAIAIAMMRAESGSDLGRDLDLVRRRRRRLFAAVVLGGGWRRGSGSGD